MLLRNCRVYRAGGLYGLLTKRLFSSAAPSSSGSSNKRLDGKVALITGGASGIGRATAEEFAENGARVLIADVQQEMGRHIAAQIDGADFVRCDVREEVDIAAAVDAAVQRFGRLDVMFNNAGVSGATNPTPLWQLSTADFDAVMAVNLRGMLLGTKHAARVMVAQRLQQKHEAAVGGCILCTASITGIMGGVAPLPYSVSKFAVAGLVRCAAAELSAHGVRVNGISPFAVATSFALRDLRRFYPDADDEKLATMLHDAGELRGGPPCGVHDVAKAALYLASDDARYISGHNLVVDGGFSVIKRFSLPPPPL